jgi:hypothetical protein
LNFFYTGSGKRVEGLDMKPSEMELALGDVGGNDPGRKELIEAVEAKLKLINLENLEFTDEGELLDTDPAARSRVGYILSILRLVNYLRKTPGTWDDAHRQTQLALKYVQHVEDTNMKALQLGRTVSDAKMASEVQRLRDEVNHLANAKARLQLQGHTKQPPKAEA